MKQPEKSSAAIAYFAIAVLCGLLLVPAMFVFYGAAGALGGILILGPIILLQAGVFALMRLFRR